MSDFWMPTAQMYEQLFDKPKMTEKLLAKPPFRYLHDIFLSTMSATGFGGGLYTEPEMDSKANHEKDTKISILTKMITLTEMMIGEKIDVKPSKIVAGLEPDRTNYFLQQLFRAATSGMDSTPYVRKIVGGEEGEEEDNGDAEEEARMQEEMARQQEEQARMKKQAEQDKKKKLDEKKKQEEVQRKKQEEEEDRKRQEAEAARQRQLEEQKAKQKGQKQAQAKQPNIIRDDEPEVNPSKGGGGRGIANNDDEDEDDRMMMLQQQQQLQQQQLRERQQYDAGADGKHGAFVEEAKKLMQQDDDDGDKPNQDAPAAGGGVKIVRKLGPQKKVATGAAAKGQEQFAKKVGGVDLPKSSSAAAGAGSGGFTENDIEFMKKAIQILCQSTNPLGKSIDFVTDDIDSMSKEYEYWRRESQSCMSKLDEQQRITEEVVQPLQDQLADVEEKIKEQMAKINAIKSQIMHNDISIQNLLYSVIQTR